MWIANVNEREADDLIIVFNSSRNKGNQYISLGMCIFHGKCLLFDTFLKLQY